MLKKYRIIFCLAGIFSAVCVIYAGCVVNMKNNIADSLLRLHIVGEDNSDYAQELKLCVRDRIIEEWGAVFAECDTLEQSAETARRNLDKIEESAEEELKRHGEVCRVVATVEECGFPTKRYGEVSLPKGRYTALNIRIGKAEGRNWWCVMYPPLCLTEGNAVMDKGSEEKLKNTLSKEEYKLITEGQDIRVRFRFKIAEMLR